MVAIEVGENPVHVDEQLHVFVPFACEISLECLVQTEESPLAFVRSPYDLTVATVKPLALRDG